jgi:hypothetical protein
MGTSGANEGVSELEEKQQVPPLRYPGFPVDLGGVGELYAPFLKEKGAHAALSSAAWQEIRVRFGRDDTFFARENAKAAHLSLVVKVRVFRERGRASGLL